MRIFLIKLNGIWESDIEVKRAKYGKRDYQLREIGLNIPLKDEEEIANGYGDETIAVNGEQLLSLISARPKIGFDVIREDFVGDGMDNVLERIKLVLDKLEGIAPPTNVVSQFNEKVNVLMPGNGLLQFNATMLLQDACTDALQDQINNGWRIIAACPQPDQRRPDYILGCYQPEVNLSGPSAARGN